MSSEYQKYEKSQTDDQPFNILLTHQEFKYLQQLLPVGYSFSVSNKNTRFQQRKSTTKDESFVGAPNKLDKSKRRAYAEAEQTIRGTTEGFKKCSKILSILKRNENAGPFLEPVDPIALGIPTYFEVIKHPMDLSTVEMKLKNHDYDSPEQFEDEIRLIWNNALTFNPPGSQVYNMAEDLSVYFEDLLKRDFESLTVLKHGDNKKKYRNIDENRPMRNNKGPVSKTSMDKPLTYNEKKSLSQMIRLLPTEHLWGVWNIVSGGNGSKSNEELEFDIETLPVRTARELEKYVKSKVSSLQKKKKPVARKGSNDSMSDKSPKQFKEDTRMTDYRAPTPGSEPLDKPAVISQPKVPEPNKSMQPNFRVDSNLKNGYSSESSFISDLEDSD